MKLELSIALLLFVTGAKAQNISKAQQDSIKEQKREKAFHKDWANTRRYQAANQQLILQQSGKKQAKGVVYMGDSITDFWIKNDSAFFDGKDYYDRGISGQTTTQMLVRFRMDVINLNPKVVVILAGINDIAENNGPIQIENVFGNIQSMAILAKAAGIKVVLSSVLPAYSFRWRPNINPIEKIEVLNTMIKEYASKNKIVYLDYYSAMADSRKGLPAELSADGVHPNLEGYKIMEPLAEKAIAETLKK